MWKAYLTLDQKILALLQESYLWLLDRTGIYVATTTFIVYALCVVIEVFYINSLNSWIWFAVLAFVGLGLGHKYVLQDRGENDRINAVAMFMETLKSRYVLDITFWVFFLTDVISLDPGRAITMLGFLTFNYTYVIKVRDRDKKPFFKTVEKHDLAIERGS